MPRTWHRVEVAGGASDTVCPSCLPGALADAEDRCEDVLVTRAMPTLCAWCGDGQEAA
jgi:hypothetical protein